MRKREGMVSFNRMVREREVLTDQVILTSGQGGKHLRRVGERKEPVI